MLEPPEMSWARAWCGGEAAAPWRQPPAPGELRGDRCPEWSVQLYTSCTPVQWTQSHRGVRELPGAAHPATQSVTTLPPVTSWLSSE